MANQKYRITGTLTTTLPGARLEELKVFAYKFLRPTQMRTFGSCSVDAGGNFELTFEAGATGSGPIDVYVMPIPEAIEKGLFNIELSLPGLFFPRVHIAAADWVLTGGVYTKKLHIDIPEDIWRRWAWLSEEFTVIGQVMTQVGDAFLPVAQAWVSAADVDVLAGRLVGQGIGSAKTDEGGYFTLTFPRVRFFVDLARLARAGIPARYGTEDWPDLVFTVTQTIADTKTLLLEETPEQARPRTAWDETRRLLYVTLVTKEGVTFDEEYPDIPKGYNFLFHGIGLVDPHLMEPGYATTGPGDDLPGLKDCPFGGRLNVKGQFETATRNPPRYYQVRYARWRGSTAPDATEFQPMLHETWTASRFDISTGRWEPLVIEPSGSAIPGEMVYEIPDYTDITVTKKTRLISWTTTRRDAGIPRYPDGKYDLLIKAWDETGAAVELNPGDPESIRLTVVIDNAVPRALLKRLGGHDILRTDEMHPYTPVCPVFSKTDPALGGTLPVTFDATDESGHFRRYTLSFITGHNFRVDQMVKRYDGKSGDLERFKCTEYHRVVGSPSPTPIPHLDETKDPGGFPNETYDWDIGSADVVRCAYQVRLGVWDRTINGYGYIHYVEDTMHFSIEP